MKQKVAAVRGSHRSLPTPSCCASMAHVATADKLALAGSDTVDRLSSISPRVATQQADVALCGYLKLPDVV